VRFACHVLNDSGMVAALEMYFDQVSERRLRTLWAALEAAAVPTLSSHTHRRHRPHLSLVAADELPPEPTLAALVGFGLPADLQIRFQFVGQFPGGVLWLGPAPTARLLALHTDVVSRLDGAGVAFWDHYRPQAWVPHTTLSMVARREAVAKAVPIICDVLPLTATIVGAAVVDHTRNRLTPLR
jgi:2'-5' RNA ligase superfamily protein